MEYNELSPLPIATDDDVRIIYRYVREGKGLPTTQAGVQSKYKDARPEWLTDITKNFNTINEHAKSWEGVQSNMIEVGGLLVGFAKDLCEYGEEAVNLVKDMDGYRTQKISELTPDQLEQFPSISLDGGDQDKISGLDKTVDYIRKSISEKQSRSATILTELKIFQRTITETIKPWIGSMIRSSNPDTVDMEISYLTSRLTKLKNDIAEAAGAKKNTPIDTKLIVNFESTYLASTDVMKLFEIDPVVKDLAQQIENKIALLTKDKQLKGFLQMLHISMVSLYDVVTPAITAVIQLQSHWTATEKLIGHSSAQFRNYKLLGQFVNRMDIMLGNWRTIQQNSAALQDAFRIE
ncbi:hypothetical protein [Pseudomonas fluorescens]|uniref:hypothetical protein n=1 Tax=Pseudomonas fluorescens TaxID=294 RepID=UPI003D08E2F0